MHTSSTRLHRLSQLLSRRNIAVVISAIILVLFSLIASSFINFFPETITPHIAIHPENGVSFFQQGTQFTPDEKAVMGIDGQALLFWDVQTGTPIHRIPVPSTSGPLRDIAFNTSTSTVAIAGGDEIFIVDLKTEAVQRFVPDIAKDRKPGLFAYQVALHPFQPQIASLFYNAYIFDINTGYLENEIITGDAGIGDAISIAYSPNGQYLATGNQRGQARIWSAKDGRLIQSLAGGGSMVSDVAFDATGGFLATANDHTQVIIWNIENGQQVRTINISPIWDYILGRRPYANPRNWTTTVSFSPDGKSVAAGGSDASAGVWNIATGKQVLSLQGHTDYVLDIEFSPNGQQIVTTGLDNTIIIWNIRRETK